MEAKGWSSPDKLSGLRINWRKMSRPPQVRKLQSQVPIKFSAPYQARKKRPVMKIPTSAVTVALATACVASQQSVYASAFVPSSTKTGTRCASIIGGNQNSHSHTVRPASADESSSATSTTRRPEWSPSSWRDVKDDEQDAEEDESIARAAKKISK